MIAFSTRRLVALWRDPIVPLLAATALIIAFLLLRLELLDLQNLAGYTGLDLLLSDVMRDLPQSGFMSLLVGLLLALSFGLPAFLVLLPNALEVPAIVAHRSSALAVRIGGDLLVALSASLLLISVLLPLGRLTTGGPTQISLPEAGLACTILILHAVTIALWIALWYAPRPARLWQYLGAWLGPLFLTIDLLAVSPFALGYLLVGLMDLLILLALIAGAVLAKLRIWDGIPIAASWNP